MVLHGEFEDLVAPRIERNKRDLLEDILIFTVNAFICNANMLARRQGPAMLNMICVEYFGFSIPDQGFLQTVHAEGRVHAVADAPRQYPPRVPINNRHQIHEAVRQPDIRDVSAPDLIRPGDLNAMQQVRIDPMLRVRPIGRRSWRHPGQSHPAHQALRPFAVDSMPLAAKEHHYPTAAVKRVPCIFLVDRPHQQ